ncbi:MAG: hypothetical protein AABZ30_10980 [Myxococcota bacterium]
MEAGWIGLAGTVLGALIVGLASWRMLDKQLRAQSAQASEQEIRGLYAAAAHAALVELLAVQDANLNIERVDLGNVWAKVEVFAAPPVRAAFTKFANLRLTLRKGEASPALQQAATDVFRAVQLELGLPMTDVFPVAGPGSPAARAT